MGTGGPDARETEIGYLTGQARAIVAQIFNQSPGQIPPSGQTPEPHR